MSDVVLVNNTPLNSAVRQLRRQWPWLLALIPFSLFLIFASLIAPVAAGADVRFFAPWVPSLDVNFSFLIDGLGLYMALIVSGIGVLVFIYAGVYLRGEAEIGRFYLFIPLFMAAMLGLVLSSNIFMLFICWELTSITSFFPHRLLSRGRESAKSGATGAAGDGGGRSGADGWPAAPGQHQRYGGNFPDGGAA